MSECFVSTYRSRGSGVVHGSISQEQVTQTKCGLPIIESPCTVSMAWRIERISPSSSILCSGHSANGMKCDAKIAKYRRAVAAPTVLKSMLVLEPDYGVVFTLHTPSSILKELYEVTVSNFPACTYRGFRYMCTSALGNPTKKWILCKHLYFILQNRMFYTVNDAFIHCPGWTTNEVRLLMSRMESKK